MIYKGVVALAGLKIKNENIQLTQESWFNCKSKKKNR